MSNHDDNLLGPPPDVSYAEEDNDADELSRQILEQIQAEMSDVTRPLYGTWSELISYLVMPYSMDVEFRDAFLLTLLDISTPMQLVKSLCVELLNEQYGNRAQVLGSAGMDVVDDENGVKSIVARLEWIVNIFRVWVDRYPSDWTDDVVQVVRAETSDFFPKWSSPLVAQSSSVFAQLRRLKCIVDEVPAKREAKRATLSGKTKRASFTSLNFFRKFTDGDDKKLVPITDFKTTPVVVARQLTRMQGAKFAQVQSRELLAMEHIKGNAKHADWSAAPTVLSYVTFHNRISAWTLEQVNTCQSDEDISIVKFLLNVVEECVKLGNFESAFAVIGGLRSVKVKRTTLWRKVMSSDKYSKKWSECAALIAPEYNHRGYREKYDSRDESKSARIPFLGIVIGALRGLCPRWQTNEESDLAQSRQQIDFSRCFSLYVLVSSVEWASKESVDEFRDLEDNESDEDHRVFVAIDHGLGVVRLHDNGRIYHGYDDAMLLSTSRILAGKPKYLIHYLLTSYGRDMEFRDAFFLCFEDFLTVADLLAYLLYELGKPPLPSLNVSPRAVANSALIEHRQHEAGEDKMVIVKCIQHWMWDYPVDFTTEMIKSMDEQIGALPDAKWKAKVGGTVFHRLDECFKDFRASLEVISDRRRSEMSTNDYKRRVSTATPRFVNRVVENGPTAELFNMKAKVIAEQLTLLHKKDFAAIPLRELTQCRWMSKNKWDFSPCCLAYIAQHNKISTWVMQEILTRHDRTAARSTALELFIDVAASLLEIGNFDTAFAVLGGLSSGPVHRLQFTWLQISSDYQKRYDKCLAVTSTMNNYREYRRALEDVVVSGKPHVVFLGVTLSDLVKVHSAAQNSPPSMHDSTMSTAATTETHESTVDSNGPTSVLSDATSDDSSAPSIGTKQLVNFSEHLSVYRVLQRIEASQKSKYEFQKDDRAQAMLRECILKAQVEDQDQLYQYSLQAEPRDKKARQFKQLNETIQNLGLL